MHDRYEEIYDAALRHYVHGETMESIAHAMGVSRSTVSRLLARAREEGIVRISLAGHQGSRSPLALELADEFGVRVHLVKVGDAASPARRFDQVTRRAGTLVSSLVGDDTGIGIAWGVTVSLVARHLEPRRLGGVRVVQLNGSAHAGDTAIPYVGSILQTVAEAYGGRVVHFPVPAFFDNLESKEWMWRERSVQSVLAEIDRLDLAVFGVGSLRGRVPSHVYSAGYIEPADLAKIVQEGAVGDVCTVLLREDGTWEDIELNRRATGPTPSQLQAIGRRVCVVADPQRAQATLGALRAGVATDLVCDDSTAKAVLNRL